MTDAAIRQRTPAEVELVNATEAYKRMLARHDWFYQFSDDPTVYRKGQNAYIKLVAARKLYDASHAIWNLYAPKEFQR